MNHDTFPTSTPPAGADALALLRLRERVGVWLSVEECLKECPGLAANAEALLDLIYAEISVREKRGDKPILAEYLNRFPQLDAQLRVLFQFGGQSWANAATSGVDAAIRKPTDKTEPPSQPDRTDKSAATSRNDGDSTPAAPERRPLDALHAHTDYTDLRLLAQGGLGVVYLAQDKLLNREVAIKFIQPHLGKDEFSRQQFALEAEVTGRLQHPGVVPLYGFGETADGQMFYVMRYIEGRSLDSAIRDFHAKPLRGSLTHSLEFRQLLGHFISVCTTIAYAHNRGIVHRDVKPDNVMLGRYGETLVVDWGLALPVNRDEVFKQSGEKTLAVGYKSKSGSSSGSGAGTPAYMSPEQASQLAPTPASDIYSLGATLYKLLVGKAPIEGRSMEECRQKIVSGQYTRPRDARREVPAALEAICLKAMSLQPQDRYQTALFLAQDVERFLADEPVAALPDSRMDRVLRWGRRHRTATRIGLVSLFLLVVLALVAAAGMGQLADQQREARLEAEKARRDNLRTSALFAARSVAQEIDLRWRILENEASSPRLRALMKGVNAAPKDPAARASLTDWLRERRSQPENGVKSASWLITALSGVLSARVPPSPNVGLNFGYRDYFHGKGRDLTAEEIEQGALQPVKHAHLSEVFRSKTTGQWTAAFSVPIWSDSSEVAERTVLGVLSMTVELNEFDIPGDAILADLREDRWGKTGLILHHPSLTGHDDGDDPPRLDKKARDHGLKLIRARQGGTFLDSLLEAFADPVRPDHVGLAAVEPVLIKGRSQHQGKTGWVVIVPDRAE